MRLRFFLILSLLALVTLTSKGQDVTVRALLDTNKALIGDQIRLQLLVHKPSDKFRITFPVFGDSLTNHIEIVRKSPVDTTKTSKGINLSQEIVITVFDTGLFEVPALPFTVIGNNRLDTISTLPVGFEILSVKADSTIRDIKSVYRVPVTARELAPYILAVIGVCILIWLILYLFRNRKVRQSGEVIQEMLEPAEVTALRELEKLREEKAWLNNRIKYYYIRISEILRSYLERQYKIQALEQTTDEIMQSLKHMDIDVSDYKKLAEILKLSDFVKFAKVIPDAEQNAVQIDLAVDFVRKSAAYKKTHVQPVPDKDSASPEPESVIVINKNRPS